MKALTTLAFCVLVWSSSGFAQPLPPETQRVASYIKVWGFLKYYHPEVAKGKLDWDEVFMTNLNTVLQVTSTGDLNDFYLKWLDDLGNVRHCRKCDNNVPDSLKFNLDRSWLEDSTQFSGDVIQRLLNIEQNRNQGKNYWVHSSKYVHHALCKNEKSYEGMLYANMEMRVLGLARYWNIINYFYPYKYVMDQDWNDVLIEMIPSFMNPKDEAAYHLSMLELVVKLNDSHSGLVTKYTNEYFGYRWAPFTYQIIDNKAVVDGFIDDSLCRAMDVQVGDVVLEVEGESIQDIIERKKKYVNASNPSALHRNFYYGIFNGQDGFFTITYERNGVVSQKELIRYFYYEFNKKPKEIPDSNYRLLDHQIGYINLDHLKWNQVKKTMRKVKHTHGLIIDVRNYPNGSMYQLARVLNERKRPFATFTIPDLSYPGVFNYTKPYNCGKRNRKSYDYPIVLLCNETTQSHGEFTLMALQTAPNVTVIGSQTAGADGNVTTIILPGGFKTYMTGIGVYYPDGRETQRIGIIPDVEVKPTIEGIRSGRDEVLEKAIEVVQIKRM
ncbi:MAG: hypothetical protein H6608_08960 [Flavobacteriales bacterium]|nr:hypothetical protein [Bacteroidota bacterium]MCB9241250.1 hypothetical protein [Flavobacteriales bacterium]